MMMYIFLSAKTYAHNRGLHGLPDAPSELDAQIYNTFNHERWVQIQYKAKKTLSSLPI